MHKVTLPKGKHRTPDPPPAVVAAVDVDIAGPGRTELAEATGAATAHIGTRRWPAAR